MAKVIRKRLVKSEEYREGFGSKIVRGLNSTKWWRLYWYSVRIDWMQRWKNSHGKWVGHREKVIHKKFVDTTKKMQVTLVRTCSENITLEKWRKAVFRGLVISIYDTLYTFNTNSCHLRLFFNMTIKFFSKNNV